MNKYIYKSEIAFENQIIDVLNQEGKNGWQCVSINKSYDGYAGVVFIIYLMKEIKSNATELYNISKE